MLYYITNFDPILIDFGIIFNVFLTKFGICFSLFFDSFDVFLVVLLFDFINIFDPLDQSLRHFRHRIFYTQT